MGYIPTYEEVRLFVETVRSISDYDFSNYSIKSFTRRLEKIISDYHFHNVKELIVKIVSDRLFLEKVVKEITVNTTEFFRDPDVWVRLKELISEYLYDKPKIVIWSSGCSTGQEVYSMLFLMDIMGLLDKVEIYGSDLNNDVVEVARKGQYRVKDVMEYKENFETVFARFSYKSKIEDFFDEDPKTSRFIVKEKYRKIPYFTTQDLTKQVNIFGKHFDIIMCRNVLIYFEPDLQNKLFKFFYDELTDYGFLVLGKHESILGEMSMRFKREDSIYIKKPINRVYW